MDYQVIEIEFATPEYDDAIQLRYEVLRKPLGLFYTPEDLTREYDQLHLACYHCSGQMVGYLNLTPVSDTEIKMRQVAVSPFIQKQGIGALLVNYSEAMAQYRGFQLMSLHARETAVPFYLKLGYNQVGDPFEAVSIPHLKMIKRLGAL